MTRLVKNYWMVLLVGAYFALTSIYNTLGVPRDVYWTIGIKTVKDLLLITLIAAHIKKLPNVLSMLFAFGGISAITYLMVFRWVAAFISYGDYDIYWEYMKSDNYASLFTIIIFIIFTTCNYLNKK